MSYGQLELQLCTAPCKKQCQEVVAKSARVHLGGTRTGDEPYFFHIWLPQLAAASLFVGSLLRDIPKIGAPVNKGTFLHLRF